MGQAGQAELFQSGQETAEVPGAEGAKNQFGGIAGASLHDRKQDQTREKAVIPIGDRSPCVVLIHVSAGLAGNLL
jgi:hypothetical protein